MTNFGLRKNCHIMSLNVLISLEFVQWWVGERTKKLFTFADIPHRSWFLMVFYKKIWNVTKSRMPCSSYGCKIFLSTHLMKNKSGSVYFLLWLNMNRIGMYLVNICKTKLPVELLCSSFFNGVFIFGEGLTGEPTFW